MCIICRMRNGYTCCLLLVAVDIIKDMLPQVAELPYMHVLLWVHRTKGYIYSTIWNNSIIWCSFSVFECKHLFKINRVHGNTVNMLRVPILAWPGMTSSFTSRGWRNNITKQFVHKFVSYTLIYYKKCPLLIIYGKVWKVLMANHCCAIWFSLINVSPRKTVQLKIFLWIFSHPNLVKILAHVLCQMV